MTALLTPHSSRPCSGQPDLLNKHPITGHGRRCAEIIHRGVHKPVPATAHYNPLATPTTPPRALGHSSAAASPSSHSSVSDGRYSTTLFIMGSIARAARISSEDTP